MKVSVLGCGRWGSFIAWYLNKINHDVLLWGRGSSSNLKNLKEFRKNSFLTLEQNIQLTSNIEEAISFSELIVISISAQSLRGFLKDISLRSLDLSKKAIVLCMKGIEKGTGLRLSQVAEECIGNKVK